MHRVLFGTPSLRKLRLSLLRLSPLVLVITIFLPFTVIGILTTFSGLLFNSGSSLPDLPPLPLYQELAWMPGQKPPATSARPYDMCLMYDKPERTGSSTIMFKLKQCWAKQGFILPWQPLRPRHAGESIVDVVLSTTNTTKVGFARDHFHINDTEIEMIRTRCKDLFYVTSVRPMKNRIMSKGKYDIKFTNIARNSSLNSTDVTKAHDFALGLITQGTQEPKWERYPFQGRLRIPPDYIIRHDSFQEDFGNLLQAFGCSPIFRTTNVHFLPSSSVSEAVISATPTNVVTSQQNQSYVPSRSSLRDVDEETSTKHFIDNLRITHNDTLFTFHDAYAKHYNRRGLEKILAMEFPSVDAAVPPKK